MLACASLQVCTMRSVEKSLRDKTNELQKAKANLSEQLEIKQRTILQLQKVGFFLIVLNFFKLIC